MILSGKRLTMRDWTVRIVGILRAVRRERITAAPDGAAGLVKDDPRLFLLVPPRAGLRVTELLRVPLEPVLRAVLLLPAPPDLPPRISREFIPALPSAPERILCCSTRCFAAISGVIF